MKKILFIILVGAGLALGIFMYLTKEPVEFQTILVSYNEIKSYKGDGICDSRIDESSIFPDDCTAVLKLGPTSGVLTGDIMDRDVVSFHGKLTVKNKRVELQDLKPNQIRCYGDSWTTECSLTKESHGENETVYTYSARLREPYVDGYIPVGVEIKLDDGFHIAAIDEYLVYNPTGYNYKKWGGEYRVVLVPLQVGGEITTPADIDNVKELINQVASSLNSEAAKFNASNTISFTFKDYPTCTIEQTKFNNTIAGLASACGIETGRQDWHEDTFTVLVYSGKECSGPKVLAPGQKEVLIPARYGSGGQICIAIGHDGNKQFITENIFHEFLHGFGASDHYDWLNGKNPSYTCNVSKGMSVCPVAASEVGWIK